MGWLWKRNRGIDINALLRTRFWFDIARIVDTDLKTQKRLAEYVYLAVADARINETDVHIKESQNRTLMPQMRNYLTNRKDILQSFKELHDGPPKSN